MMVNGKLAGKMAKDLISLLMVIATQANIKMVALTDKAFIHGPMEVAMKDNLKKV